MKEELKAIQAGLDKIYSNDSLRRQLEAEQGELQVRINKLEEEVAAGNTKAVNDLIIAKARLQVGITKDLTDAQNERKAMVEQLRAALIKLGHAIGEVYVQKIETVKTEVEAFLAKHMDAHPDRNELRDKITNANRDVYKLGFLSRSYYPNMLSASFSEKTIIEKCSSAVFELKDLI